ncbi:MAG: nickel-dependent hydrogenase large subunit [Sulfuricurvum sp.]|nr:nickel-dependent hydrogenase large subunit [Sulfuricurvum sp.]MDD5385645.1 nickel-dependent hydrogenase large subunit [Sulfuricurvum sp.]
MITRKWIERIEGEASVQFTFEHNKVSFATIAFPHFRGMEAILHARPAMDALVITPRVCGICGHSHLFAAVRAIESVYANSGFPLEISPKAEALRELTLSLELIQNHFKWLYLVIYPELSHLVQCPIADSFRLKGAYAASLATKVLAIFAGQWPHSSYMIPGGVTCDPTYVDTVRAMGLLDELIRWFEKELTGISLEEYLHLSSTKALSRLSGDMGDLDKMLRAANMHKQGFSYDRYCVLGEHGFSKPSKNINKRTTKVNAKQVTLENPYTVDEKTYAKNALYQNNPFETGPLARAIINGIPLIKHLHRSFRDSTYSRIMARSYEIALLLNHCKILLQSIRLDEPSFIEPHKKITSLSGEGVGIVEAPRGPLMHKVTLNKGIIDHYALITPTQWNLASGSPQTPGPAQKAMIGADSIEIATFTFRAFDVCSVCTTH